MTLNLDKMEIVRAHADCINASNPYHRCTELCGKQIGEAKMVKGGKDYGSPVVYVLENHGGNQKTNLQKKMGEDRRVYPDCINSSNPFHRCANYCFERKSKSNGQQVKEKAATGLRKMTLTAKERSVRSECINASNPYHVCAEYCYGTVPNKELPDSIPIDFSHGFSKKKKNRGKSPESTKGYFNSALVKVPSVCAPPPSNESEKVEAVSSCKQSSEETFAQDPPPMGGNTEIIRSLPASKNVTRHAGPKDIPVAAPEKEAAKCKPTKQDDDDLGEKLTSPAMGGSLNSNISEVTTVTFENSDDDEARSEKSNSKVLVGKYYIKESNSSILESIFEQHGDIAASCVLESALLRSYYLDSVCSVVRELQSTPSPFMLLTKSRAKELSAILKDIESSEINVSWLRRRLDDIMEAMDLISHHRAVKAAKVKCDQSLESTRKELESLIEGLARKEQEVADAKARILETKQRLSELELESSQLCESFSSIRSKIENLQLKPMSDAAM